MKIGNLEVYGTIYKITNIINDKVYIGQTTQEKGFDDRYKNNLEKNTTNKHLKSSIRKYGIENFKINKIIDIAFSKEELDIKEQCWISNCDSFYNGYNNTLGGCGTKGISGSMSPNAKKVVCLNYLKIFDCLIDGAMFYNINNKDITSCCLNQVNCAGEYKGEKLVWVYHTDYLNMSKEEIEYKLNKPFSNSKKVINLNTQQVFNSIREAGENFNISPNNILLCCQNKRKTSVNCIWMYYGDYLKMPEKYLNTKLNQKKDYYCSVMCLNDGKIFESYKEAGEYYKLSNVTVKNYSKNITKIQNRKLHKDTNTSFEFLLIENNILNLKKKETNYNRKIICLETKDIFDSASECCKNSKNVLGISVDMGMLCSYLKGKRYKSVKNLHFQYYDEYINNSNNKLGGENR